MSSLAGYKRYRKQAMSQPWSSGMATKLNMMDAAYRTGAFKRRRPAGIRSATKRAANLRTGGFLGIENKFLDAARDDGTVIGTTLAGAEIDDTTNGCLNGIPQGDGPSDRDGNRYIINRITVQGRVDLPPLDGVATVPGGDIVSLFLVQDKQTNGVQLNAEDVFTGGVPYLPLRDQQYMSRFTVLDSAVISLNYGGGLGTGVDGNYAGVSVPFTFNKSLNLKVQCSGSTAPIATITDNSLHLIAVSKNGVATFAYNSRVMFRG